MKDKSEIISHFILCIIIICILYKGLTYKSYPTMKSISIIEKVSLVNKVSEFKPLHTRNIDTTKFNLIIYPDTVKKITHNIKKEIISDTIIIRDTNSIGRNIKNNMSIPNLSVNKESIVVDNI